MPPSAQEIEEEELKEFDRRIEERASLARSFKMLDECHAIIAQNRRTSFLNQLKSYLLQRLIE